MKMTRRPLALLLSILTALASVPQQAVAQVVTGAGAAASGVPGVAGSIPRIELNGGIAPLAPSAISLTPGFAPSLVAPQLVPGAAVAPAAAIPALPMSALSLAPHLAPSGAVVPAAAAAIPEGARAQLATGADKISAAVAKGEKADSLLDALFTGANRAAAKLDDAVSGFVPSALTPTLSAPSAEGQTPPTPITLEAMAIDSKQTLPVRQAAVAQIAKSEGAKDALVRIAEANPQGGTADYEVHRAALKALAEQGDVRSLRPVSAEHKAEILNGLVENKPASAVFDYDDTLSKFREPISAPVAAGLKASSDAGVKTAILTDRPDAKKNPQDVTILDSLESMTAEQKANLAVGSNSGARITTFKDGQPVVAHESNPKFTDAQNAAILAASAKTAEKYGQYEYKGAYENLSAFKWVRFLPVGLPLATVTEAARFMQAEMARAGVELSVTGRTPNDPKDPPYIAISLIDKTLGMEALQTKLGFKGPMLLVGDSMFEPRMIDAPMTKAAGPGSRTIAVGGLADPRIENVFLWPTKGAEASLEILGALAKPKPASTAIDPAVGAKAIKWMYIQDAISMSVFILTSIAYPMIVIPAVGAVTYGVLMALGPLAAIALGPLSGMIANRFAPREGLAILSGLRAVLTVALPVMALTGMISFWPLLIASIANGWQFSLLMTSRSAYTRRFALTDPKQSRSWMHIGNLTTIGFSIYFVLQVLLGSIGQIGGLVDAMDPMMPFWISAAVNVGLVGLNYLKIPKIAALVSNAAGAAKAKAEPFLEKAKGFVKKFWKEMGLFGVAMAVYQFGLPVALPLIGTGIGSPLFMAGALMYWITRTATFKSVMATPKIRNALLLSALAAGLIYPFQNLAMPLIAASMGAKALIYGQLLGAFFFGQLMSNASMARLPEVSVLGRKFGAEKLLQAGVLGLAALWVGLRLFPGSILAVAAAVALGAGVIAVTSRLTNRGWIKFYGVGLMAAVGVALSWGFYPGIFASVMLLGLFAGPFVSAITSYISGNSDPKMVSQTFGVSSSLFNAMTSFGYGLLSMTTKAYGEPSFPAALTPIIAVYLAAAVVFFLAPRWLPGLPEKSLRSPEPKKPAA